VRSTSHFVNLQVVSQREGALMATDRVPPRPPSPPAPNVLLTTASASSLTSGDVPWYVAPASIYGVGVAWRISRCGLRACRALSDVSRVACSSPTISPRSEFCTPMKVYTRLAGSAGATFRSTTSIGRERDVPNLESEDFGKKIPAPALPGLCLEPPV
jgi:hypothetical protein